MATENDPSSRTARAHVIVREEWGGHCLVHPAAAPQHASYGREEDARAELSLFLRAYFERSPPEAKSRLSLPGVAALMEVGVVLPHDDPPRRRAPEIPVTFACVVVPARAVRDGDPPPAPTDRDDVWVLVPVLDHAVYVERGEPLEETVRAEIRRLVGALDLSAWEELGLLPPRATRLEVLEIPLPEPLHGDAAEARHERIAQRARRRQAREALLRVATPVSEIARREALPPLVGRDADLARLTALLDGKDRVGVLVVGPEHAGKSALVQAYAASGARSVWGTSGAQLIAGTSGLGQWQERIREVMEAIAELDAVLYFESLDDVLAERVESGGADLAGAMRAWLDEGKVRICAEIREDREGAARGRHWAFFAGLGRLRIAPLSTKDTRLALERRAAHDARRHPEQPRVAADAIGPLVDLAERYLPYGAFPGKAVRLYEDLRAAHEKDRAGGGDPVTVGRRELYQLFSIATGVPEMLLRDDAPLRVEDVAAALGARVIGQPQAVRLLAETIGVVKAGLQPSGKPLATFLFIGPTGVGKTELARALAEVLFGSADRMARFDMSEFMTAEAAERLIRGREDEAGLLTRRVREQPFTVLLLDEIEKAHPAVFDLLLQVAGEGRLTDAQGQTAYFHNAILIMTSNLGSAERRTPAGFGAAPAADLAHYQRIVEASFRQELVNRIDRIVPFRPLSRAEVREVARLGVARLARRSGLADAGCTLAVSEAALGHLADGGYSETYGGRAQRRHLDEHLAAPLARMLARLGGLAKDLVIDVTLADEPAPQGAPFAVAEAPGMRITARSRGKKERAEGAHDHEKVAWIRRHADAYVHLDGVTEMRDHIELLVAELNLTQDEKEDRRTERERAELGAEHHRLAEIWRKVAAAQEEIHALEELAIVALFEGQGVGSLLDDAEKAFDALERAMPYALVALEPRRDAIALMIEEIDEGALRLWLAPLLDELPRRGWSAIVHVHGGERAAVDAWPADRKWGPPRPPAWVTDQLVAGVSLRNLILRVKGPYAGVFLALEAGLHRMLIPKTGEGGAGDGEALHVGVRALGRSFDLPDEAWTDARLAPPPPADSGARKRGRAAREHDRIQGLLTIHHSTHIPVAAGAYWTSLDVIAFAHLLRFDDGSLDRDSFFAPEGEGA
jgi:ATP-dependent Clp protease ATP-binding subunit ClpC